MNHCGKCGSEYNSSLIKCPYCGTPVTWKRDLTERESAQLKQLMKDIELSNTRLKKIKGVDPR